MAKVAATQSAYQILEDIIVLAGGLAKLGRTIAGKKIQSSADAASNLVHTKVDLGEINSQLSDAKETLAEATNYVMHSDVKQMVNDASNFVRKHPVTTLVSVIAVGTLIAGMLRPDAVTPARVVKRSRPAVRKTKSRATNRSKVTAKARAKSNGAIREHA